MKPNKYLKTLYYNVTIILKVGCIKGNNPVLNYTDHLCTKAPPVLEMIVRSF